MSRGISIAAPAGGQQQLCKDECCVLKRVEDFLPRFHRKYKAGLAMAQRQLPPELLHEIRDLAAGGGNIVARRGFGAAGPGLDTDLDAMEQVARAAATGLTEGALATLLEQQAQTLGPHAACPDCGAACPVRREPRPLATPGLTLTQSEPVCHCPACRRGFFPPATPAAPRPPRPPSRRPASAPRSRRTPGVPLRCR